MNTTQVDTLDKTIQQTNELLKDIQEQFGWEGEREIAYHALRAVLHTLRDRLTVNEAIDFSSQLPLLLKGLFYDGWNPSKMPVKMNREEFLEEIRRKFPLSIDVSREDVVRGVLLSLRAYISKGEMDDVKDILPHEFKNLLAV